MFYSKYTIHKTYLLSDHIERENFMIDSDQDIEAYQKFLGAGGIQTPETKIVALDADANLLSLSDRLSPLIMETIDYTSVQSLVDALSSLCDALISSHDDLDAYIQYIDSIATPIALQTPLEGHKILLKIAPETVDPPVYIQPLVDDTLISVLADCAHNLQTDTAIDDVVELMQMINDALAISNLPQDLIDRSEGWVAKNKSISDNLLSALHDVTEQKNSASANRQLCEDTFRSAYDFTLASMRSSDDDIQAIYPA